MAESRRRRPGASQVPGGRPPCRTLRLPSEAEVSRVSDIYRPSLSTLTDLYELTMGAGYEATGVADREAVFSLSFRNLPFDGGYALAAGLDDALEILEGLRFDEVDIEYLRGLQTCLLYTSDAADEEERVDLGG